MTQQDIPEWAWERAARRKLKVSAYYQDYPEQVVYFEQLGSEFAVIVTREEALSELNRNPVTDEMVGRAWATFCEELTRSRDYSADDLTPDGMRRILEAAFARKEHHD